MTKTTATAATRAAAAKTFAPALCLLLSLLFSGCSSTPKPDRVVPLTGDHLAYHEANIAACSKRNKVLWQYRAAATAIRRDKPEIAKTHLDAALAAATAVYGKPDKNAAKSRGLFSSESRKLFVGEPYERIMANFYRALLHWSDGEHDNARALLRTAALLDSDTADKTYAADYILLDYLEGLLTAKLSGDNPAAGADSLARARAHAAAQHAPAPPDYDLAANVHLFVEYGRAPQKYAAGKSGERLQFKIRHTPVRHVRLHVAGRAYTVPAYDDLAFQAITRGPRVMDYILGNKVVFKKNADAIADVAGAVPALLARAASHIEFDFTPARSSSWHPPAVLPPGGKSGSKGGGKSSGGGKSGGSKSSGGGGNKDNDKLLAILIPVAIAVAALMAVYVSAKALSNATKTEADTRAWDNLPRHLCYLPLVLPPGEHAATLSFLDENMRPLWPPHTQTFTITVPPPSAASAPAPKDTIILRSQLID